MFFEPLIYYITSVGAHALCPLPILVPLFSIGAPGSESLRDRFLLLIIAYM